MKLAIFTSLFLLALVAGIHGACSYTDGTGHTYDFSTLTKPSSGGTAGNNYNSFFFESSDGNKDYYVNICAQSAAPCNTPNAVCQKDSTGGAPVYYYCGNADDQTWGAYSDPANTGGTPPADGGATVTYKDGQFCSNSNPIRRQSSVSIKCLSSLKTGAGVITAAQEYETCKYSILMNAKEACTKGGATGKTGSGSNNGSSSNGVISVGTILLIIVIALVILYIIIGMAIKYTKYESGFTIEIIPNIDFWKSFPFLIKDGVVFSIRKITCNRVCGEYSEI